MPKILVVEDDGMIRELAVELLSELGHTVEQAGTAAEAIDKVKAGGLNAVMIDVGLPDQPGDVVVKSLRQNYPDLPVLIASGGSEAGLRQQFAGDGRIAVVSKPYMLDTLDRGLTALGVMSSKAAPDQNKKAPA